MSTEILDDELIATSPLLNGDCLYEEIDGQIVELPPMSVIANIVASRIPEYVGPVARAQGVGQVVTETLFDLAPKVRRRRRPDAALVSFARWPKDSSLPEAGNAWEVIPDLAVEIVSPSDPADDLMEKVWEYFEAGVQLVWVIYPRLRLVHIYRTFTDVKALTGDVELDGAAVLPGFRLPLATLFQGIAASKS